MKGAVTVLQAILIFAIAVSIVGVGVPWAVNAIGRSLDMGEMGTIRDQMQVCNGKLVGTARSGTSNTCVFSANRGTVKAEKDGIYYELQSSADICDEHSWSQIDEKNHLESTCTEETVIKTYEMRWRWPSKVKIEGSGFTGRLLKEESEINAIEFDQEVEFKTLTVIVEFDHIPGQAGKIVELSRKSLTEETATLSVNIR